MNNLFEHTSEGPDTKICNLTMENLRWLKTGLSMTD